MLNAAETQKKERALCPEAAKEKAKVASDPHNDKVKRDPRSLLVQSLFLIYGEPEA